MRKEGDWAWEVQGAVSEMDRGFSAVLSSSCGLCFLASPPSKKPEQVITHPETFLKLSIGCLRYCSVDFSLILSCPVQEKHFLISKYNRFTSLPWVRSTFPLSHRKRFMSSERPFPPPHGWHAFRAFWPLCVLFPLPGLFQPWQAPFLTSNISSLYLLCGVPSNATIRPTGMFLTLPFPVFWVYLMVPIMTVLHHSEHLSPL